MDSTDIITDCLVIGAGVTALSFVDELLTSTADTSITIVDRRDVPGGHWNDAYPFVKLHQPATFYGVNSTELTDYRVDEKITTYLHHVMRDRFLPSGRVRFLPATEFMPDGTLRSVLSGRRLTVTINKKLVDATVYTNVIPINHTPSFTVEDGVSCIPPNHLPRLARSFSNYTVLGGGKTAIDACMWLLSNGAGPSRIQWVIPNDYWYANRAKTQNGPEFFLDVFGTFIEVRRHIGAAKDARDFALRHEQAGFWMRLDETIEPESYHGATVSVGELAELRKIKNIVRKGRVTRLSRQQMVLTAGSVAAIPDTLYIDCTACAFGSAPPVPIFQPGKIVLQMVRYPQIPFSAAFVAVVESLPMSDAEKNSYTTPVIYGRSVEDYIRSLDADFKNRQAIGRHPALRKWIAKSRLEGFATLAASVRPDEKDKMALLGQIRETSVAAGANLRRLVAQIERNRARL